MGARVKTQKNLLGFKQNPKKSLDQNLTPKKSHAEFPSHKNFQRNYAAGIHVNYHIITPKNPYLNQATKKKYLPKFSYPKKSWNLKFQTQKILRSSLKLEIHSTPPGWGYQEILPEFRVFIPIKGANGPYIQQHLRSTFLMPNSER